MIGKIEQRIFYSHQDTGGGDGGEDEKGSYTPELPLTQDEWALKIYEVVVMIKKLIGEGNLYVTKGNLRDALRLMPLINQVKAKELKERSAQIDIQYRHGKGIMSKEERDTIISEIKAEILLALARVPEYLKNPPQV